MEVRKEAFFYELNKEKVAKFPLNPRSDARLLVYDREAIMDSDFRKLHHFLNEGDLLVFNNAKVIPARLFFKRSTGAVIEVLLLEPVEPSSYEQVFKAKKRVVWECIIGNLKRWKVGENLQFFGSSTGLEAKLISRERRWVELCWNKDTHFGELISVLGALPIPPYLDRETEDSDYENYQTVYAKKEGSVAAPTAGLHFDDHVFGRLKEKGVQSTELTLHVGAGTFLPVKEKNVVNHPMHREQFSVEKSCLLKLKDVDRRIAVGTTSLRLLESLYWIGSDPKRFYKAEALPKLFPYESTWNSNYNNALDCILGFMQENGYTTFHGSTEIMILPQYKLRSVHALITNFHLPESTLLMIIASCTGKRWKQIYDHAIKNNYRFLSYGDGSLLFVHQD